MRRMLPRMLLFFLFAASQGCDSPNGTAGGGSMPKRQQIDQIKINMPLSDAENLLGAGKQSAKFSDLASRGNPVGPEVESVMNQLDWYMWGPGDDDNYVYIGVTRDQPQVVKDLKFSIKEAASSSSGGKTCPFTIVTDPETGAKTINWKEPEE